MNKSQKNMKQGDAMTDRKTITAYKGFDMNLQCRGYQYKIGGEYIHEGEVKPCESGFHACEHPLDVFGYYPPVSSRFCVVELDAGAIKEGDKSVSAFLSVKAELTIPVLIEKAIAYVFDRATPENTEHATGYGGASSATGDYGASSATGTRGASSATGYGGASSATGDYGASSATGTRGASSATGTRGASSATGDYGASSATGDYGASSATGYGGASSATGYGGASSATGTRGASSATGTRGASSATGYGGASSATGDYGASSATGYGGASLATGDYGASSATGYGGASSATGYGGASSATGKHSVAMASGYAGKALASEGCAIFLVERNARDEIINVFGGIAGRDGLEPDTWYTLKDGKPVEVDGDGS